MVATTLNNSNNPKKMKKLIAIASFLLILSASHAQMFRLTLRASYSTQDVDELIDGIKTSIDDQTLNLFKQGTAGLGFRLNFGKIYLNSEANFAINSAWDSIDSELPFFEKISSTIDHMQHMTLSVPVHVGFKVFDVENLITGRIYAGPEFYTTMMSFKEIDFNTYSLNAGIGFDLLNFIMIDARVTYMMASKETSFNTNQLLYSFSIGLLM